MKNLIAVFFCLSVAFAVAEDYDVDAVGEESVLVSKTRQKIRIRKYDQALKELSEKEAALNADLKLSPAEVAAMTPNDRVAYDDRVRRERERVAKARAAFEARKADLTEEDLKLIAERDAQKDADREAVAARKREIKEASRQKREALWEEAKRNGEIRY